MNWLPAPGCDLAAAGRRAPLAAARSPYALWRGGWLDLRAVAWLGRN